MNLEKYKLVNRKTGDVVFYSQEKVNFGGEWGSVDFITNEPNFEWQDNIIDPEELLAFKKQEKIRQIKEQAKSKLTETDFKVLRNVGQLVLDNASLTTEEYYQIEESRQAIRDRSNELEMEIKNTNSIEEIERINL